MLQIQQIMKNIIQIFSVRFWNLHAYFRTTLNLYYRTYKNKLHFDKGGYRMKYNDTIRLIGIVCIIYGLQGIVFPLLKSNFQP